MKTTEERFFAKVNKTATCWNWTASIARNGYGRFRVNPQVFGYAHRVAYELEVGPIPEGLHIDHICHNRACVNPAHLRPVTHKQNMENRIGASRGNQSGYRGVSWYEPLQKWVAYASRNGKRVYLGYFTDRHEAGAIALSKRMELYTHNDADRLAA